jgi:DNA-binding LacI/PurR family transcriptional regulator
MTYTQHQIVKRLGISRATLHRVLTDSPKVKPATRERVLEELQALNYVPNAIAQSLKTSKSQTLGIMGPATANASQIDKLTSLYVAARELGYSIIFAYSDGSPDADANSIRELQARMVDGIIAFDRGLQVNTQIYQSLVDSGKPLVTLYPTLGVETDCVYVDTRDAFRRLTKHLIDLGHKDIGLLITASKSKYIVNRELGFRDAMQQAELPINDKWIIYASPDGLSKINNDAEEVAAWNISDYQYGFWGASLLFARQKRPSALVCFTDEAAIGVLRAAQVAEVSIPDELALVSYNDKEDAKFARVPLTTMHQPDELIGHKVLETLVQRINGELPKEPQIQALSAKLVVRESCGATLA